MEKIRLLLADDHTVLREGLAALLNAEDDMQVVAQAANGQQAVEQYQLHQPDVTLMDLQMPVMDGYAAVAAIRALNRETGILVLTTYDGDEDIYRALKAGANGYLLKDASAAELLEAVRQISQGRRTVPADIAIKLSERVTGEELTSRESDVIQLMVRGFSNQEIAAQLFISEGTVKTHINHILSKLAVTDRTQAVVIALKRGLARLS